jgi:hypothetical protein
MTIQSTTSTSGPLLTRDFHSRSWRRTEASSRWRSPCWLTRHASPCRWSSRSQGRGQRHHTRGACQPAQRQDLLLPPTPGYQVLARLCDSSHRRPADSSIPARPRVGQRRARGRRAHHGEVRQDQRRRPPPPERPEGHRLWCRHGQQVYAQRLGSQ